VARRTHDVVAEHPGRLDPDDRRTAKPRVSPLTYFTDGDDVILIAPNSGRPQHPAWYRNVKSRPEITIRSRGLEGRYAVRETADAERERLWALATHWSPQFAKYFDADGLQRRMDYVTEILGSTLVAHYTGHHRSFGSLIMPTRRRVFRSNPDGTANLNMPPITIDIADVVVE
jgi:deazaflavin-dependent oxidoreductase (nitroreductase family)